MKKTSKSQYLKEFLESVQEDGIIDRHRSHALAALLWAEESESDAGVLNMQVDKIAAGFTTATGIAVPEYMKPPKSGAQAVTEIPQKKPTVQKASGYGKKYSRPKSD